MRQLRFLIDSNCIRQNSYFAFFCAIAACAADSLAIGTRKGEQET